MGQLGRRAFIGGACCALHMSSGNVARAQAKDWVCGTVDRTSEGFGLVPFQDSGDFKKQDFDAAKREFNLTPFGTARVADRWRRSDGMTPDTGVITLGVHFLNGDEGQKAIVRKAANQWLSGEMGQRLKFSFDVPRPRAHITIDMKSDRNNSIVGRNSAAYTQSQATMNLLNITDDVVMHEFGHAIGLNHEHQNPNVAIKWNKPVVIAEMAKQGWTAAMCEFNIFQRYASNYACVGDPGFNVKSIMLYQVPARWTLDGFSSTPNYAISEGDRRCVVGIYRA